MNDEMPLVLKVIIVIACLSALSLIGRCIYDVTQRKQHSMGCEMKMSHKNARKVYIHTQGKVYEVVGSEASHIRREMERFPGSFVELKDKEANND